MSKKIKCFSNTVVFVAVIVLAMIYCSKAQAAAGANFVLPDKNVNTAVSPDSTLEVAVVSCKRVGKDVEFVFSVINRGIRDRSFVFVNSGVTAGFQDKVVDNNGRRYSFAIGSSEYKKGESPLYVFPVATPENVSVFIFNVDDVTTNFPLISLFSELPKEFLVMYFTFENVVLEEQ